MPLSQETVPVSALHKSAVSEAQGRDAGHTQGQWGLWVRVETKVTSLCLYILLRGKGHLDVLVSLWPTQPYRHLLCGYDVDPDGEGLLGNGRNPTVHFRAGHS